MRTLHILAIIASFLCCYLEWGDRSAFLFQMVSDVFVQSRATDNFSHPAVAIPLAGLVLLFISAFLRKPRRWMMWAGSILPGLLVVFILLIGLLGGNWRIAVSTLPFIVLATSYIFRERRVAAVEAV